MCCSQEGLAFFECLPFSPLEPIEDIHTRKACVSLWLKRDDLIDPYISGNKFRKLKYNLLHACKESFKRIVSVGGAHSNHLYAVSFAAKRLNVPFTALVRGDEGHLDSPTLEKIATNGHTIKAVPRSQFREKRFGAFLESGDYFIPEGGTTPLALQGVAELVKEIDIEFEHIVVPCGTGGTLAGLVSAHAKQPIGIEVLKGGFIAQQVAELTGVKSGYEVFAYHFGGYAKNSPPLQQFMQWFAATHNIQVEFVYSGKMLFGLYDLMRQGFFKRGSTVVAVHTGGLR